MTKAFTIVELLVTVTIIAVLSSLAVVSFKSARVKARDTQRASDIKQIQIALEAYARNRLDGRYPVTSSANIQGLCLDSTGLVPTCGDTIFMSTIPSNPLPGGADYIYNSDDGFSYTLTYQLEGPVGSLPAGVATATPGGIQ